MPIKLFGRDLWAPPNATMHCRLGRPHASFKFKWAVRVLECARAKRYIEGPRARPCPIHQGKPNRVSLRLSGYRSVCVICLSANSPTHSFTLIKYANSQIIIPNARDRVFFLVYFDLAQVRSPWNMLNAS